jgi:hypothetical protein
MMEFVVERSDGSQAVVILLKHKEKTKYSFINLTKGHICPCEFDSIEEAMLDMDTYISKGSIIHYTQI